MDVSDATIAIEPGSARSLVIYGAGGFAREVAWLAMSARMGSMAVRCFIDDRTERQAQTVNGIPVLSLEQARDSFPEAAMVVALGDPGGREKLVERAMRAGFDFCNLVHERAGFSEFIDWGNGNIVCAGVILTTNIVIGHQVQINLACTIGHDVIIEDYVTLAPGVHISGRVLIGRRAYVGTGAVVINGNENEPLVIAHDAVVGAGACVTKNVPAATTVVGVPARPLVKSG